jgi:hypothetical protein
MGGMVDSATTTHLSCDLGQFTTSLSLKTTLLTNPCCSYHHLSPTPLWMSPNRSLVSRLLTLSGARTILSAQDCEEQVSWSITRACLELLTIIITFYYDHGSFIES